MVILIVSLILIPGVHADVDGTVATKRQQLQDALDAGILTPYDIPFEVCVEYEMWDCLDYVLENNHHSWIRYEFPGLYYSRPYIVGDNVWVFENSSINEGGIYVIRPDTLKPEMKLQNPEFKWFEGGVRIVRGQTVVSGGSDKDVDMVVIWDTKQGTIRTLKIQGGHYVSSLELDGNNLYVGSCGGIINIWDIENLSLMGTCSTSEEENLNWTIFNEKECINAIYVRNDRIYGAGEKSIFIWDKQTLKLLETYPKEYNDASVVFHQGYVIEFKNTRFAIRDLTNGNVLKQFQTPTNIEDIIITRERLFPDIRGKLLLVSFRNNMGLSVYDFRTLLPVKHIPGFHGARITAWNQRIFATDDRNLFRYHFLNTNKQRYYEYLANLKVSNDLLTDDRFGQLMTRLRGYPDVLNASGICRQYLENKGLELTHTFKYGKIGHRFIPEADTGMDAVTGRIYKVKEDVYGYKAVYIMTNKSQQYYLVRLDAAWAGEYGNVSPFEGMVRSPGHPHAFFLIPGGQFMGQMEVGEKEPLYFSIFPIGLYPVTESYYKEFRSAISRANKDTDKIRRFLSDERVVDWHPRLKKRLEEIESANSSWWKRLMGLD